MFWPQNQNEKNSLFGWGGLWFGSISNSDDKIATILVAKLLQVTELLPGSFLPLLLPPLIKANLRSSWAEGSFLVLELEFQ